jgi:hypothetical protein
MVKVEVQALMRIAQCFFTPTSFGLVTPMLPLLFRQLQRLSPRRSN